jgi:hypothetical protein
MGRRSTGTYGGPMYPTGPLRTYGVPYDRRRGCRCRTGIRIGPDQRALRRIPYVPPGRPGRCGRRYAGGGGEWVVGMVDLEGVGLLGAGLRYVP